MVQGALGQPFPQGAEILLDLLDKERRDLVGPLLEETAEREVFVEPPICKIPLIRGW